MHKSLLHLSIIFLLLIPVICKAQDVNKSFKDLYALAGTWRMETSKGILYESWNVIDDSTLKSKSYKVTDNDTLALEQVELVKRNNAILYIPSVLENNNVPVIFTLVTLEKGGYTFENKEHDFPQRIIYTLPQNNTMHAWIEGDINGHFKKSDYNYIKVQ